jgi:cell division protein FtsB
MSCLICGPLFIGKCPHRAEAGVKRVATIESSTVMYVAKDYYDAVVKERDELRAMYDDQRAAYDGIKKFNGELTAEIDRLNSYVIAGYEVMHDELKAANAKLTEQVKAFRAALEKISDPRKMNHTEPDLYTKYGCLIHLASEVLAKFEKAVKGE